MITPETSPLYYEQKIAEKLGIARDALRAIRKAELTPNEDYGQPARETVLSASGLLKLLAFLKKENAAIPEDVDFADCMLPPAPGSSTPAPDLELLEFTVIRPYANVRLLLCSHPATGAAVNVRVKSNENFRRDMTLNARWQERERAYVMEGRCPRYPGRY